MAWSLQDAGPTALTSFDEPADSVAPIGVSWPPSARELTLEPGRVALAKPTNVIACGAAA